MKITKVTPYPFFAGPKNLMLCRQFAENVIVRQDSLLHRSGVGITVTTAHIGSNGGTCGIEHDDPDAMLPGNGDHVLKITPEIFRGNQRFGVPCVVPAVADHQHLRTDLLKQGNQTLIPLSGVMPSDSAVEYRDRCRGDR